MDSLHGVKKEKGLLWVFCEMLLQKGLAALKEDHVDVFMIEAFGDQAVSAVIGKWMHGQLRSIERHGGGDGDVFVLDVGIHAVCSGTVRRAEKDVETVINRASGNRLRAVDAFNVVHAAPIDDFSVFIEESHTDMPFPDKRSLIALFLKHVGHRKALFFDQAGATRPDKDASHPSAKLHAACQNAVARRRAGSRGTMRILKAHPHLSELIQIGRRDLRFWIIRGDISVSQVVYINEQNIRQGLTFLRKQRVGTSHRQ